MTKSTAISFDWQQKGTSDKTCPACSASCNPKHLMLNVPEFYEPLAIVKCRRCGTCFYESPPVVGYLKQKVGGFECKHYVEIGVGVQAILETLLALPDNKGKNFLDIGCGFGFAVDFWTKFMNAPAIGLEMAAYGQEGRERLGADIRPEYLGPQSPKTLGRFDVVYACEVIEHVDDPLLFIQQAAAMLSPSGIVCMTTPNAHLVRPESDLPTLAGSLAPGHHNFLLSAEAIAGLFDKAGLRHVHVQPVASRLYAWGSNAPLPQIAWPAPATLSYDYLRLLSETDDLEISGGALYRLLRNQVNAGNNNAVSLTTRLLRNCVYKKYGFDLLSPAETVRKAVSLQDADTFFIEMPCYLGHALFYIGMSYLHNNDLSTANNLFKYSQKILKHTLQLDYTRNPEAGTLLPQATHIIKATNAILRHATLTRSNIGHDA